MEKETCPITNNPRAHRSLFLLMDRADSFRAKMHALQTDPKVASGCTKCAYQMSCRVRSCASEVHNMLQPPNPQNTWYFVLCAVYSVLCTVYCVLWTVYFVLLSNHPYFCLISTPFFPTPISSDASTLNAQPFECSTVKIGPLARMAYCMVLAGNRHQSYKLSWD